MQNEHGDPPDPYHALERDMPEEHPVDAAIERRVPQRKLRKRMRQASDRLMQALGDQRHLWLRLEELLGLYRSRREDAYFNLGYEHGVAAGRVQGLRALDGSSIDGQSLADRIRELAVQADVDRGQRIAALLEAAWALALDLDLDRRTRP